MKKKKIEDAFKSKAKDGLTPVSTGESGKKLDIYINT